MSSHLSRFQTSPAPWVLPSAVSPVTGSSYWLLVKLIYSPPNIEFFPFSFPSFWLRLLFFHFSAINSFFPSTPYLQVPPFSTPAFVLLLASLPPAASVLSCPLRSLLAFHTQYHLPFWFHSPSSLVHMLPSGQTCLPVPGLYALLPFLMRFLCLDGLSSV